MLLLWILFVACILVFPLSYCLVYSLQPCGQLLAKGRPFVLLCVMFFLFLFFRFVTFSYDVLGQVWSLIVLISDLCVYFTYCPECIIVSEYDQEIPQSQTADNPVASREEPLNHHRTSRRQIKQSNQLSLPHQDDCNTRMDIK